MTLKQLASLCGGSCEHLPPAAVEVRQIAYDSRLLRPHDPDIQHTVFVALAGPHRNGHTYLQQAWRAGVRYFLVATSEQTSAQATLPAEAVILAHPAPLQGLQQAARGWRQLFELPVIGIVGSAGKTIVKEWIASLLPPQWAIHKSPRSFNSQLGVALTLLGLQPSHQVSIVECGATAPGEMPTLADLVKPTIGVLAHLNHSFDDAFGSFAAKCQELLVGIRDAKVLVAPAAEMLPTPIATALQPLLANLPAVRVSWQRPDPTQLRLQVMWQPEKLPKEKHWPFTAPQTPDTLTEANQTFVLPFPQSTTWADENAALAFVAAWLLGLAPEALTARLPELQPVSLRQEFITDNQELNLLLDSYNADALSLRVALARLQGIQNFAQKKLILSDILHQGPATEATQLALARLAVAELGQANVCLVGPVYAQLAALHPDLPKTYPDIEALLADFRYEDYQQTSVLLKGASKFGLQRLVPRLSRQAAATALHIDLDAVRHNLRFFRSHLPTGTGLVPMLKAAGYGSGGWQLAAALEAEGIAAIGVAYTGEGIVLRTHGIRSRILVLNADFESLDQLHGYGLEPAVWSIELLHALGRLNQPLHIHLEFDTGMARLGFLPQELPAIFEALAQYPLLQPVGLFSHLAAADDPAHDAFTHQQIATFTTLTAALQVPYPGLVTHLANTAGMLRFPTATGSWARLGLGLYGLAPIADYQGYLQEAATLRTAVSQVRHYPAGTSIGYSRSQVLATPATIATLPVGYADGYPRNLSNGKGNVLLQGVRCPIVGRVCMDMLMVDVSATPTPVRPGDEAVLFGTQLGQHLSVQEIADAAGTIPYEILAGMSQRIRRVFGRE